MRGWPRRRVDRDDDLSSLAREVDRLRQENMCLRMERQRPVNVSAVIEELRAKGDAVGAESRTDEAYHVLAQAETARRAVLDALDGLSVAAAQMRRQLTANLSGMEIDRRVEERRRPPRAEALEAAPSGGQVNGHEQPLVVAEVAKVGLDAVPVPQQRAVEALLTRITPSNGTALR